MNTNKKGDIALSLTVADLIKRGCDVFLPVNDHPKSDVVALVDGSPLRIQVKHSSDGMVRKDTVVRTSSGYKRNVYSESQIDGFAVYLSEIDIVVYVPVKYAGISIRHTSTASKIKCWWYEDFLTLDFSDEKVKRIKVDKTKAKKRIGNRENWPDRDYLSKEVWNRPSIEIAKELGISDRMVGKMCEEYGISKPPRGYWSKRRV